MVQYKVICHHGIKGQRWGKRNGPPYPLDDNDKSDKEKSEEKKSVDWKTVGKVAAISAGVALAAYGGYKLSQSDEFKRLVSTGKLHADKVKNVSGVSNPKGYTDNCKECSEATLKRWLGVDPGAVAGVKSVTGDLHDFIKSRNYNKEGVEWIKSETDGGISPSIKGNTVDKLNRIMTKQFKDGDCGMISVGWDKNKFPVNSEGHAFNWFIQKGVVNYYDDQPDKPVSGDAILKYFNRIDINKEIEVVKISKRAFEK